MTSTSKASAIKAQMEADIAFVRRYFPRAYPDSTPNPYSAAHEPKWFIKNATMYCLNSIWAATPAEAWARAVGHVKWKLQEEARIKAKRGEKHNDPLVVKE
jgi:hypothetical protein